MKISRLRLSDVKEVSTLLNRTIKQLKRHYTAKEIRDEVKRYSAKNLQTYVRNKANVFSVAKDKDKIVGVICAFTEPSRLCWIDWIVVKKSYWRNGIGSMLIRDLEKTANGRWDKIRCRTRISNMRPSNMFEKLCYKKLSTLRRRVHKRDAYTWEKIMKNSLN
jgi:ribosomal protein S18 acetylase RimI-like enzyme